MLDFVMVNEFTLAEHIHSQWAWFGFALLAFPMGFVARVATRRRSLVRARTPPSMRVARSGERRFPMTNDLWETREYYVA